MFALPLGNEIDEATFIIPRPSYYDVLLMYFMRCVRHGGINMIIFGLLRLDVN